ncbi:DUF1178 family protein [Desulfospira joergensenii]|uniref:DUF1178 family protein n=1 Tax=Desulfospira joergensenii TaxID=53329 RepID=UPI0003B7462D|nr:DUF1178 family protein [Desulfospira joergensenii]
MIVFDLECLNGHTFEGWFEDKKDLENQMEQGILQCPVCETCSVVQKLHPIAIKKSSSSCSPAHVPSPQARQALRASQEAMAELTEKVADYVEKNFEDVGSSFTKEALKMHYGAAEHKNIRGTTTQEEEKVLSKEGVPVFKVPVIKKENEDLN